MTTQEDLHAGRGWLNRAAEMLDSCEDHLSDAEFARAAATIGHGFVALAHATQSLEAMASTARRRALFDAAAEREERAEAEARPHDDEDAERRADRHAEITEAERSAEVHGG